MTPEVAGRYRLEADEAELARGGIGRILVAFDGHLGREVALKELPADADGAVPSKGESAQKKTSALAVRFLRETGLRLDGFDLESAAARKNRERRREVATKYYEPPPPGVLKAHVDCFGGEAPAGTVVELLDPTTHEPLSPPVTARSAASMIALLAFPAGMKRGSIKIGADGWATYTDSPFMTPGAWRAVYHVPAEKLSALARAAGETLQPGKGHILGRVFFQQSGAELLKAISMGCVTIDELPGAPVFYIAPGTDTIDPGLDATHPLAAHGFVIFNLEPGPHLLKARVGEHEVEDRALVHADSVTRQTIGFSAERFPVNPTLPLCMADWVPTATKAAPQKGR